MHFENVLKRILVLLLIYSTCNDGIHAEGQLGDPYRILEIERKASSQEIRQAYKKLAKKWYVYQCDSKLLVIGYNRIELDLRIFTKCHFYQIIYDVSF